MSSIGNISSRTTMLSYGDQLLSAMRRSNAGLLKAQEAISTGLDVRRPSDDPAKTTAILSVLRQLSAREQHDANLLNASKLLDATVSSMSEALGIIRDAHSVALAQASTFDEPGVRAEQAVVIDNYIDGLIDIVNEKYGSVALYGGDTGGEPFERFLGGVRYTGSRNELATDAGLYDPLKLNTTGDDAFNSLTSRVKSEIDLDPAVTAETKLADLTGALNRGIRTGSINITVGANPTVTVDLGDADTLENVIDRINAVIDPADGDVQLTANGLQVNSLGPAITIEDPQGGKTAADLGIDTTVAAATSFAGADLDPKLTIHTKVVSLGAAVDMVSGLKITQGSYTKVADFSGAETVQDMMNIVESLELGLRLEINDDATGFNMVSEVSGINLSIGENGGGSTATDLGLRSLDSTTQLADFNYGKGVEIKHGEDDMQFILADGTTFNVNLDGAMTLGDVVTKISDAATVAGLTVGTDFSVGMATDGNGLTITDGTGPGGFTVKHLNESHAALDLGLTLSDTDLTITTSSDTLTSTDRAMIRAESVFTHLIDLSKALRSNNTSGITFAASALEQDDADLVTVMGKTSARSQRVLQQQERSAEMKISEQILLSDLRDADLTEVITNFTQLQQQLSASFQVGALQMQLSFLDFLR